MKQTWTSAMRQRLSLKASVRGLAFIGAVGVCVGLIAVLVNNRQEEVTLPLNSGMSLRGFQINSYDESRLQMRVSGDSLTLSKSRLWGPFRLGFAHVLIVRNLKVEIFSDSTAALGTRSPPRSVKETWTTLTPSLSQLLRSLPLRGDGGVVMSARLSPLQVVEQRAGQTTILLKADSCETTRALKNLVCTNGFVWMGEQDRPFRKWRSGLF